MAKATPLPALGAERAKLLAAGAGVFLLHDDGTSTYFPAAEDTDLARGEAAWAARDAAASGDTIQLGKGGHLNNHYTTADNGGDTAFHVPLGVKLKGLGVGITVLYRTIEGEHLYLGGSVTATGDVYCSDLSSHGDDENEPCLVQNGCTAYIHHCHFKTSGSVAGAMWMQPSSTAHVNNVTFEGAIKVNSGAALYARNCVLDGTSQGVQFISGTGTIEWIGGKITVANGDCIDVGVTSTGVFNFYHTVITPGGSGSGLTDNAPCNLWHCHIHCPSGTTGVKASGAFSNYLIANCTFTGEGTHLSRINGTLAVWNSKFDSSLISGNIKFLNQLYKLTTAQRDAAVAPAAGLTIFNSTTNKLNVYNGSSWDEIGAGTTDTTGNTVVLRDAGGRIQAADAVSGQDVANYSQFDSLAQTMLGLFATVTSAAAAAQAEADKQSIHLLCGLTPTTTVSIGDGKAYYVVTPILNGKTISYVNANVLVAGTTGLITVNITRIRSGVPVDVLATPLTIDSAETNSSTAATPPVINGSNDDLATGDVLRIDVDSTRTGTNAQGLIVVLEMA